MKSMIYRLGLATVTIVSILGVTNYFTDNSVLGFIKNHFPTTHQVPDNKRVVVASIEGGMGNQFFMYAAAYSLAKRLGAELWLKHKDNVLSYTTNSAHRPYTLSHFSIVWDKEIAKRDRLSSTAPQIVIKEENFFTVKPEDGQVFIIDAYFEAESFFKDNKEEIKKLLTLNQESSSKATHNKHYEAIKNSESVAVHIRRGDFFKTPEKVVPFTYQILAMSYIKTKVKNAKFFIFSDDAEFARTSFINLEDVIIVSEPNGDAVEEFELMRSCKHIITTNSTFSWWAAWLNDNPNKLVISPYPRYVERFLKKLRPFVQQLYRDDPHPKEWININPFKITIQGPQG